MELLSWPGARSQSLGNPRSLPTKLALDLDSGTTKRLLSCSPTVGTSEVIKQKPPRALVTFSPVSKQGNVLVADEAREGGADTEVSG